MSEETTTNRETVSIGLDFRPIPVDLGDGKLWNFDPDPDPEVWDMLVGMMRTFAGFKDLEEGGAEALEGIKIKELSDELTEALARLLVTEDQKAAWRQRRYGLLGQQRVAAVVMKEISGFPTKSESSSGEDSDQTGPDESPTGTDKESAGASSPL